MDSSVIVSMKYSNRQFAKLFKVTGPDFETTKNAVKATGAKFDGNTRRWIVSKPGLESLKTQFTVEPYDFGYSMLDKDITFRATGETALDMSGLNLRGAERDQQMIALTAKFQAAYTKSDDAVNALNEKVDAARRQIGHDLIGQEERISKFFATVLAD
jgi:hypothetical protein